MWWLGTSIFYAREVDMFDVCTISYIQSDMASRSLSELMTVSPDMTCHDSKAQQESQRRLYVCSHGLLQEGGVLLIFTR